MMHWPILQRLLSTLPGVRRGEGNGKLSFPFEPGTPKFVPPTDLYPRRILAALDWSEAINRSGATYVTRRPADWVIVESLDKTPNDKLQLTMAALMEMLHREGGYLIANVDTCPTSPEATVDEAGHIQAPPEWWWTKFEEVADLRGLVLTPLWRSMYLFNLMRLRAEAADSWTFTDVFMMEVRPQVKAAVQVKSRGWLWKLLGL